MKKFISISFIFLMGIALGLSINCKNLADLTLYLPAMATLMAAYFGAKYAFDLQNEKEKKKIRQRNIVNGNFAIFNISRMIDNLLNYQKQIINPVRDKPTLFIDISPTLPSEKDNISLNFDQLSFLLETNDPNILKELDNEESGYQRVFDAIRERTRIHRCEVQPLLEKAGFIQDGVYLLEDIESALGDRLCTTLKKSTKEIVEYVDSTINSLREVGDKLTHALKGLYPEGIIMSIDVPDPSRPVKREEP